MKRKVPLALSLLLTVALFSGCASTQTRSGKSESHVLGLVKLEQRTHSKKGPLTIGVDTSELITRTNPSGGRLRFFFGLFTIADD